MKDQYYLRPIVKSLGGKTWFRDKAWKFYYNACNSRNKDMRWVDPFCGGLAVPFYIMPNNAWINDANIYLINLYNHIVSTGKMRDFDEEIKEHIYYTKRQQFNNNIKNGNILTDEMAELFYYLNKTCYGGISRYNNSGFFNAPFSKYKSAYMKTDYTYEQKVLSDWQITSLNYSDVLAFVEEDDFLFIDPPYDGTFNKYIKRDFTWDDQVKLATSIAHLNNPIVATNSTTDRIIDLYKGLGFELEYKTRKNSLQNALTEKPRSEKFKEAIFYKNIKI